MASADPCPAGNETQEGASPTRVTRLLVHNPCCESIRTWLTRSKFDAGAPPWWPQGVAANQKPAAARPQPKQGFTRAIAETTKLSFV